MGAGRRSKEAAGKQQRSEGRMRLLRNVDQIRTTRFAAAFTDGAELRGRRAGEAD